MLYTRESDTTRRRHARFDNDLRDRTHCEYNYHCRRSRRRREWRNIYDERKHHHYTRRRPQFFPKLFRRLQRFGRIVVPHAQKYFLNQNLACVVPPHGRNNEITAIRRLINILNIENSHFKIFYSPKVRNVSILYNLIVVLSFSESLFSINYIMSIIISTE